MLLTDVTIPEDKITDFCVRWRIQELALFGSVLREDFRLDSDLDILATFAPEAEWSLFDQVKMEQELAKLLGRDIDLVSRQAVEQNHNWLRRNEILKSAQVIYASR